MFPGKTIREASGKQGAAWGSGQRFSFASRRRDYDLLHERATAAAPSMVTASKVRVMIVEKRQQ
jgi:hypothetical protein